ncbi:MAG: hypothetical protein ABR586_07840 [Thermoplasmatota archaeon]
MGPRTQHPSGRLLPWPLFCRAVRAFPGGRRAPLRTSLLLFALPWSLLLALFLALRWREIAPAALFSYLVGTLLWLLAPGLLYLHHVRHLPAFADAAAEVARRQADVQDALAARTRRYRRLQAAFAGPLFAVALLTYWQLTSFLFAEGGFHGWTDPLFWSIFAAWMAWFGLVALPGLASIVLSLRAVCDLARGGLRLRPLHADGVGGLAGVGRFIVQSTLGISMACLFLPMTVVALPRSQAPAALVVTIGLIVGGLMAAVAWPLSRIQGAALRAKREALGRLEQDYERLTGLLRSPASAAPKGSNLAALAHLRLEESGLLVRTPTLPIPLSAWARLALQALVPVLLSMAQAAVKSRLPLL